MTPHDDDELERAREDKIKDPRDKLINKRPKRASDGIIFSNNPTSEEMMRHEEEIALHNPKKSIDYKNVPYSERYLKHIREQRKKTFLGIIMLSVLVVVIAVGSIIAIVIDGDPLVNVGIDRNEASREGIGGGLSAEDGITTAMNLAKNGKKMAAKNPKNQVSLEELGDKIKNKFQQGPGDATNLSTDEVKKLIDKNKDSAKTASSAFVGGMLSKSKLESLFGSKNDNKLKDKDSKEIKDFYISDILDLLNKDKKGLDELVKNNKFIAEKDLFGNIKEKEQENPLEAKKLADDQFNLIDIKQKLKNYPLLSELKEKIDATESYDLSKISVYNKTEIPFDLLTEKISNKFDLETLTLKEELFSSKLDKRTKWAKDNNLKAKEYEKFLSDFKTLLEYEQIKYAKWANMLKQLETGKIGSVTTTFISDGSSHNEARKDFLNRWELLKSNRSLISTEQGKEIREQILASMSLITMNMVKISLAIDFADYDKIKLEEGVSFLQDANKLKTFSDFSEKIPEFKQNLTNAMNDLSSKLSDQDAEAMRLYLILNPKQN